jgi:ATP-binding cassette, subfamily B, bacterial
MKVDPAFLKGERRALEGRYRGESPVKTLLHLYGPHWVGLLGVVFFFVLKSSPHWILPLIAAEVVDAVAYPEQHSVSEIWWWGVFGTIVVVQNIPTHSIYYRILSGIARKVEASLRLAICSRLQELSISFYKFKSPGVLQSKTLRDVEVIDQFVRQVTESGLAAICSVVSAIIVTAIKVPSFLPFYLLTIPIAVLLRAALRKRMKELNRELRTEIEGMTARVSNMIEMIPITRAHGVEDVEMKKINDQLDRIRDSGLRLDTHIALYASSGWVSFTFLYVVSLIIGGWMAYTKFIPLTAGEVVMLSSYISVISSSVAQFSNLMPIFAKGFESVRSIGEVLESPDLEHNQGKHSVANCQGNIQFESVSFKHPSALNPALKEFSYSVVSGDTIAIVGPSGSGKSTLMGLILGFYRPDGGRILLDGRDMNELDLRTYRRFVAVVSQEIILFRGTIRENILYGTTDVLEEHLLQAVKDANAWEFIQHLPKQLDTMVGERGMSLSGGQKQRIAIARALIRQPKVLILDEATSALDVDSEASVQEALGRLMKGRTTFIVAHRLSTTRNAGKIIVLKEGQIAETGTPRELLQKRGVYAQMVASQGNHAAFTPDPALSI